MKAVLLSSIPLPYHKIGSWSKRYSELLSSKENPFDYVICPKLDDKLSESGFVKYLYAKRYKPEKLFKVYYRFYYYFFLKQLLSIIKKEKQLVIQIVDNVKLLNEVHDFLTDKKIRNKCVIIFNSCGYSYYFNPSEGIKFYDKIDHMIYSTNEAYQFEMNRYSYITSKVSIIPNGIDSIGFHKLTNVEKIKEKQKIGFNDKKVVLWLSQDRKKKGLHILIEAWKNSNLMNSNEYVLLIIGTSKVAIEDNINFLGKIPNNLLPKYYQCSDYYLFTTLFHEGFGLSIAEAIKCGTTCFTSNIAPMKEVVKDGKLSYLVDNPNKVSSWLDVLNKIGEKKIQKIDIDKTELDELYSLKKWSESMSEIVLQEKNKKNIYS